MGFRWDTRAPESVLEIGQSSKTANVVTDQPLPCPSGMCASFPMPVRAPKRALLGAVDTQ